MSTPMRRTLSALWGAMSVGLSQPQHGRSNISEA